MACAQDEVFTQAVNTLIAKGDLTAAQNTITRDSAKSLQQGGLSEYLIPSLAALSPGSATELNVDSSGKFLYFCKSGSTPGSEFSVEMSGARAITKFVPGSRIEGGFEGFRLTNTGVSVGSARFIIGQRTDVNYEEWDIAEGSGQSAANGTAYTAAYNSAALANAPVGTPGAASIGWVSIKQARAVRALVRSPTTITACTIRWWLYDATTARWYPSNNVETLPTGVINATSSDLEVGVRDGLAFAEIYGNTNSGATGAFTITLQVL